ncbi:hypothetical protein [Catellatospora tritici]|uniref:hypothetical protein n=1 Tax=Catellatospora tritici TaxID=2851566 RepID=UPI001C2D91BC|nr:hypothetical protein [Catellatospora tritici]MBV1850070.1 hypothetical protein [Catellatospora tritici]
MPPRNDDPRPHHYEFAHRALPSIVRRFGAALVHNAASRELTPALLELWSEAGSRVPTEARLAPDGLSAAYEPDPQVPMVVITMPPARHMVEAHFAAIVASGDQTRYLVLEESWSPGSDRATVLGEWTSEGHYNLGPGPEPQRAAFIEAVRVLTRPPQD